MAFKIKSLFVVIPLVFLIIIIPLFYMPEITTVKGHAIPDSYTLEPNSLLQKSESFPSSISILFSERPEPKISYIHVTNSEGERIDNNDFKITGENDRRGTVTVNKSLFRDGIYSISWSTLSLDDGHVAKGTYVVGVGVGSSLPAGTVPETVTDNNIVYSPAMAIVKIPIVVGQVYVLGFVFSQLFIWKDLHKQELRNIIDSLLRRRFTNSIIIISIVMVIAATLIPVFQSTTISETQSDYFKNLALLYFETTNGIAWLIRIISCVIIAFAAYYYGRAVTDELNGFNCARSRNKATFLLYILLGAVSIFIATNSFTSHSSSIAAWSQLGIITDFIHTIVVSIWIGGLMYILYVMLPNVITISKNISGNVQQIIAQPKSIVILILSRFSVVSTICVGVVGITGLFLAWLHIQNIDELLLSDYGRTLIVKLGLILPVVILGGYHQFWINRKLKLLDFGRDVNDSNNTSSIQRFSSLKTSVKIECILALGVLCVASFLTVTSPPTDSQNNQIVPLNPNGDMSSGAQDELVRTLETQGIQISLVISPFVTGFNNFTVNILGNTESIGQFSNASIEFRKSDLSLGPIFANLVKNNETSYSVNGGYLSQPGLWHIKVTVKRTNSYDLNYRTSFTVNKSGGSESLHEQHHVDSREVLDDDNPNHTSSFTPMVIGLSLVVAILSTYFCINALKRLRRVLQILGIEN